MTRIYVTLHETDFGGAFTGSYVGRESFKSLEDAKNSLLSNGYIEHDELTFTRDDSEINDYVTITDTILVGD